jgi:hypothetical protein
MDEEKQADLLQKLYYLEQNYPKSDERRIKVNEIIETKIREIFYKEFSQMSSIDDFRSNGNYESFLLKDADNG